MCQRTRWSPTVFLQLWPFEAVTSFKSGIRAVRTHCRKGGLGSRVSTELSKKKRWQQLCPTVDKVSSYFWKWANPRKISTKAGSTDCRGDYYNWVLDSHTGEVMSVGRNQDKIDLVFPGQKHQAGREISIQDTERIPRERREARERTRLWNATNQNPQVHN